MEGELNPIFIVGKESKDLLQEIADHKTELEQRTESLTTTQKDLDGKIRGKGKEFTNIAKVIGVATKGLTLRNCTKTEAEKGYDKIENFAILDDSQLEGHALTAEQKLLDKIGPVLEPIVTADNTKTPVSNFLDDLESAVSLTAQETAESIIIERLAENPEIEKWVESGLV